MLVWQMSGGCVSAPAVLKERPVRVGAETRVLVDEARDRTITYEVFYPAAADAVVRDEVHVWVYSLPVARGAPIQQEGPHPVVVTSHGSGGSRWDLFWLAQTLVAHGFIVVSVDHPGDTWTSQAPLSSLQVWERPRDMSAVLDDIAADERWGPLVDTARVAAAGHSVGGFSALALVGLRYDIDRAVNECLTVRMNDTTCVWVRQTSFDFRTIDYTHAGDTLRDPRVKAAFVMTPAVAEAANVTSARSIAAPVWIVGSQRDGLTPLELHALWYADLIPGAKLTVLEEADHYAAVSPCNGFGAQWISACRDRQGFDRVAAQRRLGDEVAGFFDAAFVGADPALSSAQP